MKVTILSGTTYAERCDPLAGIVSADKYFVGPHGYGLYSTEGRTT